MARYFEDWGDKTVQSGVPAGWGRLLGNTTGSISIEEVAGLSGKVLRITGVGGGAAAIGLDAAGTPAQQQVFVMFSFTGESVTSNSYTAGPGLRVSDSSVNYYMASMFRTNSSGDRDFRVFRRSTLEGFSNVSNTAFLYAESTVYALLAEADGTTIRAKVWAPASLSNPAADEPASWTVSGTNESHSSGAAGIAAQESASAIFDVFAVGVGTAGDTAPMSAPSTQLATPTGFTFTSHGSLRQLDGAWDEVPNAATYEYTVDYETTPDTWVALTSASIAGTSFQLTDTNGVDWGTTYRSRVRAHPAG